MNVPCRDGRMWAPHFPSAAGHMDGEFQDLSNGVSE